MSIVRLLARPMIGAIYVIQGAKQFRDPAMIAPAAKEFDDKYGGVVRKATSALPESHESQARIYAGVHMVAGAGLATGTFPRLSATALAATMIPTTLVGHAFWQEEDESARQQQKVHFLKNLSITGGLLLAAVDTEGKPGLTWRTRNAKRGAKRSAASARRQAKLSSRAAKSEVSARTHEATSKARRLLPG